MFRDAVAVKELSGSSRRWTTYASRVAYVGVIAAVLWGYADDLKGRHLSRGLSDYAYLGRQIFMSFFALQLVVVALGAVSAAADMITREARSGTLGLLASTPLSPWRIAFGKWKAAAAQAAFLVVCGAPVLGICASLGGADYLQLVGVCTLSFSTAGLCAAVALFFSSVFRTGVAAILVSIAALGLYTAVPILLLISRFDEDLLLFFCALHPLFGGLMTVSPTGTLLTGSPFLVAFGWLVTAGFCVLTTLFLLKWTAARITVLSRRTPEPTLLTRTFAALDRFYENLGPRWIRGVRLLPDGGAVWESRAILWKELRVRASGKIRNSVRIAVASLILFTIVFFAGINWLIPLGAVGCAGFMLMGFSNGAGLFVTEKEERKWDILLATPLSSAEIVASKLLAGLVPLAPMGLVLLLFLLALGFLIRLTPTEFIETLAVVVFPVMLCYAAAAAASLRATTLRAAFTTSFVSMVGLLVLAPVLIHNSGSLLDGESRRFFLALISPLPHVENLLDSTNWGRRGYYYRIAPSHRRTEEVFPLFAAFYSVAITALVASMMSRFNRIAGRSE